MDFQHVTFLPARASFCTTFLKKCDRCESLGTTTCLKTVVGGKGEIAPCNVRLLPVMYDCSSKASFCVSQISWRS